MITLACAATLIYNLSKLPWNAHDQETLEYAEKRCAQLYADAPCLVRFFKNSKNSYYASCGEAK
jgi:hypothetical protein